MSPVFVEMIYMLPEHSQLVQVMMFKINDEAPDFRKSQEFVDNLKSSIHGKILNYRIITQENFENQSYKDLFEEDLEKITVH
tara:strand:- start:621 stop:866 length:246 start_codon:yes stop_codon:yes gene_type:complete